MNGNVQLPEVGMYLDLYSSLPELVENIKRADKGRQWVNVTHMFRLNKGESDYVNFEEQLRQQRQQEYQEYQEQLAQQEQQRILALRQDQERYVKKRHEELGKLRM